MRTPATAAAIIAVLAGTGAGLTACSSGSTAARTSTPSVLRTAATDGRHDCLAHQTDPPDAHYRGGGSADTPNVLRFLAYYTDTGDKAFCDQAAPNTNDRAWANLYVQLTGNTKPVRAILTAPEGNS